MEGGGVTGCRLDISYTVQAGLYSDVRGRVLDFRSKCTRFGPRPGHGVFLRVRDIEKENFNK